MSLRLINSDPSALPPNIRSTLDLCLESRSSGLYRPSPMLIPLTPTPLQGSLDFVLILLCFRHLTLVARASRVLPQGTLDFYVHQVRKDDPLSVREVVYFALDIACGLSYLHPRCTAARVARGNLARSLPRV